MSPKTPVDDPVETPLIERDTATLSAGPTPSTEIDRIDPVTGLLSAMKRMAETPKEHVLPDQEVAKAILRLHEQKGDAGLQEFFTRIDAGGSPNRKEKKAIYASSPQLRKEANPISRRGFLAAAGETATGISLTLFLGLPPLIQYMQTQPPMKEALDRQRDIRRRELVEYIQKQPDKDQTPPRNEEEVWKEKALFDEIDKRIAAMNPMPPEPPAIGKIISVIVGATSLSFADRARRDAKSELNSLYDEAARYVVHKAKDVMQHEAAQARSSTMGSGIA